MKPFSCIIGGEAGYGIMSAGLTLSRIATRSGYSIFQYAEYPSLIRGGHNMVQIVISRDVIATPYQHCNFLIALNSDTLTHHASKLVSGAGVLYDLDIDSSLAHLPSDVHLFPVPLARLAKEVGGSIMTRNTVALGASVALLGANMEYLEAIILEEFAQKKPTIQEKNIAAARAGYDYVRTHFSSFVTSTLVPRHHAPASLVMTGNEAMALASIAAGMQFAAVYPMTPTSAILQTLASYQEMYGFIYKQPEDEIAAINMAIGASFAGVRSMVATSGGGFCLMAEGYGLAGMTETPLVIIEGMRGAPATGLPTWNEQGDLRFVLHAHQGDFPRIVLAPGDVTEAFHMTMDAFHLADKYQTPVVVLVDKHICESHERVLPFDYRHYRIDRGKFVSKKQSRYVRYADAEDGISTRTIPGVGNHFVANSDEHDVRGYSSETKEDRVMQMNKRMKKLEVCAREDMQKPVLYGPADARVTIVSWGSNKGAIRAALRELPEVNFLHITWMNPFPTSAVRAILERAKHIVSVEANYSGQLAGLIAEHTGIHITDQLLAYDGRPIYPEEIIAHLKKHAYV